MTVLAAIRARGNFADRDWRVFSRLVAMQCALCRMGVPHHTNAGSSIGGSDRHFVLDLHESTGGGLEECTAADILQERAGPTWLSTS